MTVNLSSLPFGLSLRPSRPSDAEFQRALHRSTRRDLLFIDGDRELIETVLRIQYEVQEVGAGNKFPDAMSFVIEKAADRIGGMVVDFGHNEIRVAYLAFLPAAQGKGYGKGLMTGIQNAARTLGCPVTVVVMHGALTAQKVYTDLGFQVAQTSPIADLMTWYPSRA